jgi:hypothetical protein
VAPGAKRELVERLGTKRPLLVSVEVEPAHDIPALAENLETIGELVSGVPALLGRRFRREVAAVGNDGELELP